MKFRPIPVAGGAGVPEDEREEGTLETLPPFAVCVFFDGAFFGAGVGAGACGSLFFCPRVLAIIAERMTKLVG